MQSTAPIIGDVYAWRVFMTLISAIVVLTPPATIMYLRRYFVPKQDHTPMAEMEKKFVTREDHSDYCAAHKAELDGVGGRVNVLDQTATRLGTRMDEAFSKLQTQEFHTGANKEHINRVEGMFTTMVTEMREQNAQKATEYRELSSMIGELKTQLARIEERTDIAGVLDRRLGEMVEANRRRDER
jgi:hypothetical protein